MLPKLHTMSRSVRHAAKGRGGAQRHHRRSRGAGGWIGWDACEVARGNSSPRDEVALFVQRHGATYGWSAGASAPTLELTKHSQSWGFFNRANFSTVGLDGMGNSWGLLAVPYLRLPKYCPRYVFVKLGYEGLTKG